MRKTLLLIFTMANLATTKAQDFKEPLQKTFLSFDTTRNLQMKLDLSNKLTLIARKWDKEWITHYYAAVSETIMSYNEKDETKRDAFLDDAEKQRDDVLSLLPKPTDETYVLDALIANARLAVKPMMRYEKYGKLFRDDLESAKAIDANNPRIYYLKGISTFYTPKAFGGGKKAALPYFEKAAPLFATEDSDDIMKPYWGKTMNGFLLAQCQSGD